MLDAKKVVNASMKKVSFRAFVPIGDDFEEIFPVARCNFQDSRHDTGAHRSHRSSNLGWLKTFGKRLKVCYLPWLLLMK
jgi:hypothetical protein